MVSYTIMAKRKRKASQKEQIEERNSRGHLRLDEDIEQFAALRHLTLTGVKLNTRAMVYRAAKELSEQFIKQSIMGLRAQLNKLILLNYANI